MFSKLVFWTVLWGFGLTASSASNSPRLQPVGRAASVFVSAANGVAAPVDPRLDAIAAFLQQHRAGAQNVAPPPDAVPGWKRATQQARLAQLQAKGDGQVQVRFRRPNGTPLQIKGQSLEPRIAFQLISQIDPVEQTARQFLRHNRELLLLEDPDNELVLARTETDQLRRSHLRFKQEFKNIPVWPCGLTVHLDPAGNVDLMDGAYIPTPAGLQVEPKVTADQAAQAIRNELPPGAQAEITDPKLVIYGPLDKPARLAWKADASLGLTQAWRFLVDGLTGEILNRISLVADAAETGSGIDALGVTRPLSLWKNGVTYYMVNTAKPMYDASSTPPDPNKSRGAIIIQDAKNTNFKEIAQVTSVSANSGWIPDAVSAAFGLSETYDYYLQRHNRNSLDGEGGSMVGIVRWVEPNAFWNGKFMAFGGGFSKAFDVVGHELTHGVIETVGAGGILVYQNQPGALNEALADIFGEMVEARTLGQPDWLVGDQLQLPEGPIRNFANPGAKNHPSKMSEFVRLPLSEDHGGVHINSSIISHAFYLLAVGMIEPIGLADSEKIFYRTMTLHLQSESQFIDMRHGCLASAEELFGKDSTQVRKTAEAFDRVEVLDAPETPSPSPIPPVQGSDSTLALRNSRSLGAWQLIRHEAAQNDAETGSVIETIAFLSRQRVAVSGDGTFTIYVTEDNDLGIVNTDGSSPELLNLPGTVHSVAMSPDGARFAFVLLDLFGDPSNEIKIIEVSTDTTRTIHLYAPGTDGARLDTVQYADAMDFRTDGQTLIYDAYTEIQSSQGSWFGAWTVFALDLRTDTITMLMDLNEASDSGNPTLGKAHDQLLAYETVDKESGLSTVYAANRITGETSKIASISRPRALGFPSFVGDDSAIVYAQADQNAASGYSLVRQALVPGSIQPVGEPTAWLSDAGYGVIYRRGTFVASNAPPQVTLVTPAPGQIFASPASITLEAAASDADGTVARVEFYAGSSKLGEVTSAPFTFTWSGVPSGQYRFIARAYDNLNAASDSLAVQVQVGTSDRSQYHPADNNPADFAITANEITAYGAAWKRGDNWPIGPNPIPADYLSRAGTLWKGGETYMIDSTIATAPLWWVNVAGPPQSAQRASRSVSLSSGSGGTAVAFLSANSKPGVPSTVSITLTPTTTVSSYVVEDHPPTGWVVSNISHSGALDRNTGKVKWGLFFDHDARTLTYQVAPSSGTSGTAAFTGLASFDGVNVPISGQRTVNGFDAISVLINSIRLTETGELEFQVTGPVGGNYTIEFASDLRGNPWETLTSFASTSPATVVRNPITGGTSPRFYRVRQDP